MDKLESEKIRRAVVSLFGAIDIEITDVFVTFTKDNIKYNVDRFGRVSTIVNHALTFSFATCEMSYKIKKEANIDLGVQKIVLKKNESVIQWLKNLPYDEGNEEIIIYGWIFLGLLSDNILKPGDALRQILQES